MRPIADIARHLQMNSEAMPSGCREWRRGCDKDGYGRLKRNRKTYQVHRISWAVHNGLSEEQWNEIPDTIMHTCDNPSCIEGTHLSAGSASENTFDMISKGRNYSGDQSGQKNPNSKLTWEIVQEIRIRLAHGNSGRSLAKIFGVSDATISEIKTGKIWNKALSY